MLPKEKRVNLKFDFKNIASGTHLETKYLKLFLKFKEQDLAKVGIATSSKVFKKANQRNQVRRIVSSAFEKLYPKLPNNLSIVALPKMEALEVKSEDILKDLDEKISRYYN